MLAINALCAVILMGAPTITLYFDDMTTASFASIVAFDQADGTFQGRLQTDVNGRVLVDKIDQRKSSLYIFEFIDCEDFVGWEPGYDHYRKKPSILIDHHASETATGIIRQKVNRIVVHGNVVPRFGVITVSAFPFLYAPEVDVGRCDGGTIYRGSLAERQQCIAIPYSLDLRSFQRHRSKVSIRTFNLGNPGYIGGMDYSHVGNLELFNTEDGYWDIRYLSIGSDRSGNKCGAGGKAVDTKGG